MGAPPGDNPDETTQDAKNFRVFASELRQDCFRLTGWCNVIPLTSPCCPRETGYKVGTAYLARCVVFSAAMGGGKHHDGPAAQGALRNLQRTVFWGEDTGLRDPTRVRAAKRVSEGWCIKRRRLIEIKRGLSDAESISTLLHEMAHAATNHGHNKRWAMEMIRLREMGAPLTGPDLFICDLGPWETPPLRVTKRHFHSVARDVFIDRPDISLTHFLRWWISSPHFSQARCRWWFLDLEKAWKGRLFMA
jgi:hypothetical protein